MLSQQGTGFGTGCVEEVHVLELHDEIPSPVILPFRKSEHT